MQYVVFCAYKHGCPWVKVGQCLVIEYFNETPVPMQSVKLPILDFDIGFEKIRSTYKVRELPSGGDPVEIPKGNSEILTSQFRWNAS